MHYDPFKPREEHHYKDYYPDLDEESLLYVSVKADQSSSASDSGSGSGSGSNSSRRSSRIHHLNKPVFNKIPKEVLPRDNSKIPRSIARLGYKVSSLSQVSSTYIRENDQFVEREQNNQFFLDISKNQLNFKSSYDMDEQDNYYLAYLNSTSEDQKTVISRELFECAMTLLENEWYHLERKIPPKLRHSYKESDELSAKDTAARAFTDLYGSDDGIGMHVMEEQHCAVCDGTDCDNSNAIIFCDGCDIAVHQDCYGVVFIPEGQWLCRRCMVSKKRKIKCQFCPSTTGAFKQTENGLWSHVLCGLWIPELYFASAGHMEPIEGIEAIPKGRWKLQCYLCKQKVGAPIQCANKSCFAAFHPTCARRAGLLMTMDKGIQGAVLDKTSMAAWCHKHSSAEYNKEHKVLEGIEKTRLYFSTIESLNHQHNKNSFRVDKKNAIQKKKKWKTSKGTPIPPNYFAEILTRFLTKLRINGDNETLSQKLTKYWCMKREMKRGAPLIRRTDGATAYNGGNPEDITEKLIFAETLLQDIVKLEDISSSITKKAQLQLESQREETNIVNLTYFPYNSAIETIMKKILNIDSSRFLLDVDVTSVDAKCTTLSQMKLKVDKKAYHSIDEFIADIEGFFAVVDQMDKPVLSKAIRRIAREVLNDLQTIQQSGDWNALRKEFVNADGLNIVIAQNYCGLRAMGDVNLSDIESS